MNTLERQQQVRQSAGTPEGLESLLEEAQRIQSEVLERQMTAFTEIATGTRRHGSQLSDWHPLPWALDHAQKACFIAAGQTVWATKEALAAAPSRDAAGTEDLVRFWFALFAWLDEQVHAEADLDEALQRVEMPSADDWVQAEAVAAAALQKVGYPDARTTGSGTDAGLDVIGSAIAAQVKYTSAAVGRPQVQQLVGAAGRRQAAFFARSGYSTHAVEFADQRGVALFTIELPRTVRPHNRVAKRLVRQG